MRTYKASLLAAATLCCPSLALAQTAPDIEPDNGAEAAPREEAIVVVGKLTDSALDRDDIEITQANDLGDLFRRGRLPHHHQGQAEQTPLVPSHDLVESIAVAAAGRVDRCQHVASFCLRLPIRAGRYPPIGASGPGRYHSLQSASSTRPRPIEA